MPNLGIKQTNTNYQSENGTYCTDAENINIEETGVIQTRPAWHKISDIAFKQLYHSKRFNELICIKDGKIYKIKQNGFQNPLHGNHSNILNDKGIFNNVNHLETKNALMVSKIEELETKNGLKIDIGNQDKLYFIDLPREILVSTRYGLIGYNGLHLKRYSIEAPHAPFIITDNMGSLTQGDYHIGISYIYDGGKESPLSRVTRINISDNSRITLTYSTDSEQRAEQIRLYMSEPNGGVLRKVGDYPADKTQIQISVNPTLGRLCEFQHKSPMIGGKYLTVAHGRLYIAQSNRLIWSETMAYHLTDLRHNWLALPERITFIIAVNSGLWIGQRTGVLFLSGTNPTEWQIRKTAALAPIEGSATLADSSTLPSELTQGGACAVWLSSNGYNIGTAGGELINPQSAVLNRITGDTGNTVACGKRLYTAVYQAG